MPPWSFSQLVLFLTAYSVIGWCFESLFCTIFIDKKLVNRGFLTGPYCPIYGFGAVGVLLATLRVSYSPVLVYLISLALTSALEFFTSWLLEKLFDMRWWDYSHCKFNLQGRICLKNALFFGFMGLGVVYLLHPPVERLLNRAGPEAQRVLASGILVLFTLDLLHTLGAISAIRERVQRLRDYVAELERYNEEHTWYDRQDVGGSIERLRTLCAQDQDNEKAAAILHTLDSITGHRPRDWRIAHNARIQLEGMQAALEGLRESWDQRVRRERRKARVHERRLKHWLGEVLGSLNPRREGLGFYRLVMVFALAGVAGYVLETAWTLLRTGVLESRQGMLYGPVNQVYGIGAVLMVWLLAPLAQKRGRWLFLGGAVLGGAFEFLCSLGQELLFGAVSWQYTGRLSLGGRTSLPSMLLWGVLAVVFIRYVYPRLDGLIRRIPKRQGAFVAWLLAVVLGVNLLVSGMAVHRWTGRQRGEAADSAFARLLDQRFPDRLMREIYPNMALVERE